MFQSSNSVFRTLFYSPTSAISRESITRITRPAQDGLVEPELLLRPRWSPPPGTYGAFGPPGCWVSCRKVPPEFKSRPST